MNARLPSVADEPVALSLSDLLALRSRQTDKSGLNTLDQYNHPGLRPSRRKGQGLEFEDLREYTSGDDPRFIDWNVTARTNRLHTRLYRDERERTTSVVVDLRSCMLTGTEALKARRAIVAATRVLWIAAKKGDRCAAIVFNDTTIDASRPRRGDAGVTSACRLFIDHYQQALESDTSATTNSDKTAADSLGEMLQWLLNAGRHTGYSLICLLYTSPSPRDATLSRMPSSA